MKERDTTIDFLRGLSVILIILIHVNAYFSSIYIANFLANYSQFCVQIFVFCSAYVYFIKKKDAPFNIEYIWKRAKRLLIPYYIFVIFFFLFILFIKHQTLSIEGIDKWIFLQGDRDLNWLVILFLYFIFLMPFIRFLSTKNVLFWIFGFICISTSVLLLFIKIPVHFRLSMWLPWSVILLYTYLYTEAKRKDLFLILSIGASAVIYFLSRYILLLHNHTLLFTENKYPPNIYYIAYGILGIATLILIHQKLHFEKLPVQPFFNFASKYSYPLFFIHFLYLYIFMEVSNFRQLHWWGGFLIITAAAFGTMWLWSKKQIVITSSQH